MCILGNPAKVQHVWRILLCILNQSLSLLHHIQSNITAHQDITSVYSARAHQVIHFANSMITNPTFRLHETMMTKYILVLLFCLPISTPKDTAIFITLTPRDYIDPRTTEGFVCGIDKAIDSDRLIAEQNVHFIIRF